MEIRTRKRFAPLLAKLTPVHIVPRGAPSRIDEPVGTGPYRLARNGEESWSWSRPRATAGTTDRSRRSGSSSSRSRTNVSGCCAGGGDVAADLDEIAVKVLRTVECCRETVRPGSTVEYLHLAVVDPRFDDRRVRQAVSLAIDRAAYVAEARHGLGQPVGQMAVPGVFGYAPDLRAPGRDVDRARTLLGEDARVDLRLLGRKVVRR